MILVDTGPLVALFDRKDRHHQGCRKTMKSLRSPIVTTVPVLTEAFHLLTPDSKGAQALRDFVLNHGLGVWVFDQSGLSRSFELMEQYIDHPMDLADASLVAAAETLRSREVFTIDRDDFYTYRVRFGHRYQGFDVVAPRG